MAENDLPLAFGDPVTLVGDGDFDAAMLAEARAIAPVVVAADGAADRLAELGIAAAAVIGDLDSIGARGRAVADRVIRLPEQETTDFEKCLYATEAPLYIGVGFTGRRLDHTLAVLHALLARPAKPIVLLGQAEAIALAPAGRTIRVDLPADDRVSIFPLRPVSGRSTGLRWPIDGLELAAGARIGTSNAALGGPVTLSFDGEGALILLRRHALAPLAAEIAAGPDTGGRAAS